MAKSRALESDGVVGAFSDAVHSRLGKRIKIF